jgi:hypothetical protein
MLPEGVKVMLTGPPKLGVGGRTLPWPEVPEIPGAKAPSVAIAPDAVTVTGPPPRKNPLTAFIPGTAEPVVWILPDEFTITERPIAPVAVLCASMPAAACDWIIWKGLVALLSVTWPLLVNVIPAWPFVGVMLALSELTFRVVVPGGGFGTPAD